MACHTLMEKQLMVENKLFPAQYKIQFKFSSLCLDRSVKKEFIFPWYLVVILQSTIVFPLRNAGSYTVYVL